MRLGGFALESRISKAGVDKVGEFGEVGFHHCPQPLALGALAATGILLGKFALELNAAVYVGTALLVAASVWNSWPKKQAPACDACGCAPEAVRS